MGNETDFLNSLMSKNQTNAVDVEKFKFRCYGALYLYIKKNLTIEEALKVVDSIIAKV